MKKRGFILICVLAICLLFCVRTSAEETQMPDEYRDFLDSLPEGAENVLPENFYSDKFDSVTDSVEQMSGMEYLTSLLLQSLGRGFSDVFPHVILLISLVILSALGNMAFAHISPSGNKIYEICSHIVLFCAIGGVAVEVLSDVKVFFSELNVSMAAFVPLSATLYTMGGNINAAVSSSTGLLFSLGVIQFISGVVVMPLFCFCLCTSFISSISGDIIGGGIGEGVKKAFMTTLTVITAILGLSLSSQTIISSKADNLAMRGARIFAGNIPVSGGIVSSSIGTIASSVELIRSVVGVGGIIVILWLLLPVFLQLWIIRTLYSLLGSVSGALGQSGQQRLFCEISELYGILEGVVIMCSLVFVLGMAILCRTAPAMG